MSHLILLRHGTSVWNERGVFSGAFDCPLSAGGQHEAAEAGRTLRTAGIIPTAVYASPQFRASSTAQLVLSAARCHRVGILKAPPLVERNLGALTGLTKREAKKRYGSAAVRFLHTSRRAVPSHNTACVNHIGLLTMVNVEPFADVEARVRTFWWSTLAPTLCRGQTVLVVAHRFSLAALLAILEPLSGHDNPIPAIPNAIPIVYDFDTELKPTVSPAFRLVLGPTVKRHPMRDSTERQDIFVTHGVVHAKNDSLFVHRNFLDIMAFEHHMECCPRYVSLEQALESGGRALTIDDGTLLGNAAHVLARFKPRGSALVHFDLGGWEEGDSEELAERLGPPMARLLAPGGILVSAVVVPCRQLYGRPLPPSASLGRYYMYGKRGQADCVARTTTPPCGPIPWPAERPRRLEGIGIRANQRV